jgi:hypothetical protein
VFLPHIKEQLRKVVAVYTVTFAVRLAMLGVPKHVLYRCLATL